MVTVIGFFLLPRAFRFAALRKFESSSNRLLFLFQSYSFLSSSLRLFWNLNLDVLRSGDIKFVCATAKFVILKFRLLPLKKYQKLSSRQASFVYGVQIFLLMTF